MLILRMSNYLPACLGYVMGRGGRAATEGRGILLAASFTRKAWELLSAFRKKLGSPQYTQGQYTMRPQGVTFWQPLALQLTILKGEGGNGGEEGWLHFDIITRVYPLGYIAINASKSTSISLLMSLNLKFKSFFFSPLHFLEQPWSCWYYCR